MELKLKSALILVSVKIKKRDKKRKIEKLIKFLKILSGKAAKRIFTKELKK